jgi:predicted RNase H-like nuclease (RuvC/YqgF family)
MNQLTIKLNDAQNKVSQLSTQVTNLESQQAQLQANLDSDSEKQQQLKSSIESDQAEVSKQQELIASRSSEKSAVETTLQKCEADIQKAKNQVDALSYEINLVVVHPYLQWGGLAIFAVGVAALIVTTVGVATLASGMRTAIVRVRRLRRTEPVTEIGASIVTAGTVEAPVQGAEEAPAEMAGEAPAEVPAKSVPEIKVVQTETEAPEIEELGKRTRPASEKRMKRKKSTSRKMRTRKKPGGRS